MFTDHANQSPLLTGLSHGQQFITCGKCGLNIPARPLFLPTKPLTVQASDAANDMGTFVVFNHCPQCFGTCGVVLRHN